MLINNKVSHNSCFTNLKRAIYHSVLLSSLMLLSFSVSAEESKALNSKSSQHDEELPLFELGIGIGSLYQPYYVGTKQNRAFAFPVPVPIYRGDFFKSDEEGVRAEVFKHKHFKLEFSLDFNLAIDSDDIDLRAGMDDIDSRLQIGPSMEIKLAQSQYSKWLLNLPVRASVGVSGDGIDESGFTFAPNVSYFRDFEWSGNPWRAGVALGPQFGSRDYQNLYYGVEQAFVTDNRPVYNADSGYAGSRLLMTLRSQNRDRLLVWFVRYENINGATFEDSPLVETNNGLSVGLIYSKFLFKSTQTVKRKRKH